MAIPLIGAALSSLAPQMANRGLDLLSGVFRGAVDKRTENATDLIKEKTGIDIEDVAEDKLTEEQWISLKEFELAHQEQLLEFRQNREARSMELEKLNVEDTQNAHDAVTRRDKAEDPLVRRFTYHYAYLITSLTFIFVFLAAFVPGIFDMGIPKRAWRVIDTVLGFLLGVGLSAIIQFFYGSSHGSKSKTEALKSISEKASTRYHSTGR